MEQVGDEGSNSTVEEVLAHEPEAPVLAVKPPRRAEQGAVPSAQDIVPSGVQGPASQAGAQAGAQVGQRASPPPKKNSNLVNEDQEVEKGAQDFYRRVVP
jgi:hypothetical protein